MAPVDILAPRFREVETVTGPVTVTATPIVRFGVVDNATTDEGPRLQKAWVRVTAQGIATDVPAKFSGGDMYRAVLSAQSQGGTTVSYQACAKDRRGNEGCSPAKTYATEAMSTSSSASSGSSASGSSGAGGSGGAGGSSTATGSAATGSTSVASSGSVSSGVDGSSGSGGAGGQGGAGSSGEDSGCGCAVPGSAPSRGPALGGLMALGLSVLARGRRRRS